MSRDRLFAAQFLAVAMFFLFLPGVSRSDSTHNDDCDTSSVLNALASSSSSHAVSANSGPRFHFASGGTEVSSLFYNGKVETTSGPGNNSLPVTSSTVFSAFGNGSVTGGPGRGALTGPTSAGTPAGSIISHVTVIPEPEVISLVVLGLAFLILRRMLTIR